MEGATQFAKWRNRLAVRLPAVVVEAAGLKQSDEIEIDVVDAGAFAVARKPGGRSCWSAFGRGVGSRPRTSSSTGTRRMHGSFIDTNVLIYVVSVTR